MDEKLRKSPTWPFVSVFALGMESQLEAHRDRGDRQGWLQAGPDSLMHALLDQFSKASDTLHIGLTLSMSQEIKAKLLKHLLHVANFAMMTADSAGVLPEPRLEQVLRTLGGAQRSASLVGEIGAMAGMTVLDQVRLSIGANEGEDIDNALIRYTAAVRLGCARALEQQAERLRASTEIPGGTYAQAGLVGSAAYLRQGLPAYEGEQNAEQVADAITQWKAEQLAALKAGILESVFPRFWEEALGNLPSHAAREKLEQLLEEFQPVDLNAPLPLGKEGQILARAEAERV